MNKGYEELVKTDLKIKPEAFANEALKVARDFAIKDLTNLRLQKLLYYSYAIFIKITEKTLFLPIKAEGSKNLDFWQFGPVIPDVYHGLKHYGSEPFVSNLSDYDKIFLKEGPDENNSSVEFEVFKTNTTKKISDFIKYSIISVFDALENMSTNKLVQMTHSSHSAWHYLYEKKTEETPKTNEFALEKIMNEVASCNFFDINVNVE